MMFLIKLKTTMMIALAVTVMFDAIITVNCSN